eukprot:PhF_6_TR33722/c1_g3_i1/m.49509
MRLRILNTLNVLRMVPLHCNRMEYFVSLIPEATFLVDTFPVNSRGPPNLFNGKYKGKCRKYQLCSSLEGTPLSVIRCKTEIQEAIEDADGDDDIHDRTHDGTIFEAMGSRLSQQAPWELGIGDKAYVACRKIISVNTKGTIRYKGPLKRQANMKVRVNQFIQINKIQTKI